MPDTRTLLAEIGTEEIPASYIQPAAEALREGICNALKSQGIGFGEAKEFHTPRRLTVVITEVPSKSPERITQRQGPPAKVAKDQEGNWTVPALKFAESLDASSADLFIKENEKGSYACVKVVTGGKDTSQVLGEVLPEVIGKLSFPRSMNWPQAGNVSFARPIRWLCSLFGSEIIEFEFAGVSSSNLTYGHRFAHPEAITINHPEEYVEKLKKASVVVDPEERRRQITKELERAAGELGGAPVMNDELLYEVTNMVEYPMVLACNLGGFMELPRQVLQTALAKHQRGFVVEKAGKLLPHFLVVTNSPGLETDLASPWFERMAVSRLEDADFFIAEDLARGLEPLVEEESRVEWIKGIGTLADKTRWLTELGGEIGKSVTGFNPGSYQRAAHLAKADLLSNLVREKEFTSLQGIAGGIYAEKLGESPDVCNAIKEQYTSSPSTAESAILGTSDRLLNICGTFVAGKPPKGSRDPFALRRQAGAVMSILISNNLHTDIPAVVSRILELFGTKDADAEQITGFMIDRLRLYLEDKSFPYDWVQAVLAVAGNDPYDSFLRLSAFRELDKGDEFRLVAVGQKRVANITKDIKDVPPPDTSLFTDEEEGILWDKAKAIKPDVESAVEDRDYKKALKLLLSIRPAIDSLFDEVYVMVEDENIRTNRLYLLAEVRDLFLKVADFSRMVVEGGEIT